MISFVYNLLGLAAAAVAAPSPPAPGAPKWVADWGDQRCSLIRETGGPTALVLMVRTVPGARQSELWLFDPQWTGPAFSSYKPIEVSLQPSGFRATEYALSVRLKDYKGIAITNLDEGFLQNLAGSRSLRIERDGRTLAEVPLPSSAKAVATLHACEAAVMRDLGLDPEVMASLSRTPKPARNPAQWFSDRDYPMESVRSRESGSVLTRLAIGTDGRVAECVVIEGSGHELLDQRTCKLLLNRGRYEPALTAAGAPIRAMTSVRIHWRLPGR